MSGAEWIAAERARQVEEEGWTPEHDDEHGAGPLTRAAYCYMLAAQVPAFGTPADKAALSRSQPPEVWPWHVKWWKPSDDPIRNLVKAGALIAAEIDRLERAKPGFHITEGATGEWDVIDRDGGMVATFWSECPPDAESRARAFTDVLNGREVTS